VNPPLDVTPLDAIIVGAGVAGLAAAEALRGLNYRILEAAPQPGGRLAAPHWQDAGFDATAQFFTARSPEFKALTDSWCKRGWLKPWFHKPDEQGGEEPAYAASQGMGLLMAHWAVQHNVSCGAYVTSIQPTSDSPRTLSVSMDRAVFGGPKTLTARSVVLTAPWPVSQTLVTPWLPTLSDEARKSLAAIRYAPCLVLEVETEGNLHVSQPGLHFMPSPEIACVADQGQKGLSPGLVMLMSPEYSETHAHETEREWLPALLEKAKPWLGTARVRHASVRYWPHARVMQAYGEPFVSFMNAVANASAPVGTPLWVCGDGFGGARVEGAFLSGWHTGMDLARNLNGLLRV
jgi:renalase